jgi:signal transduction histidine kinase
MSPITVIWSMVASTCLTLAVVQGGVWWRRRGARAHALFALSAAGTALLAGTELWMMHAVTPGEYGRAVRWLHVPAWLVIVPLVGFERLYLRAGRRWLGWTTIGFRSLSLILDFVFSPNLNYRTITGVHQVPWLGEPVTVATGVPNPWMLIGQLSLLLWVIFSMDAALTVWRRGEHQKALMVGGSVVFFALAGTTQAVLVFWGVLHTPITASLFFLGIILAMSVELSREMFRVAEIGRALQASQEDLAFSRSETLTLSGRLIVAQDDERARLARAIHDGLSQSLALLAVELDLLGQQLPQAREQVKGRVEGLASQAKAMSADVHRIAHGLHPAKLEQLGLAAAMAGHCRDVERVHAIEVLCECRDVSRRLAPDVALCLYRVTQEALQNVIKHSGAKRAVVDLAAVDGEMRLSIADDGKGFDLEAARASQGLGLLSMRERVRLVHGRIDWRSQPGSGTRVEVRVPLPPAGAKG